MTRVRVCKEGDSNPTPDPRYSARTLCKHFSPRNDFRRAGSPNGTSYYGDR